MGMIALFAPVGREGDNPVGFIAPMRVDLAKTALQILGIKIDWHGCRERHAGSRRGDEGQMSAKVQFRGNEKQRGFRVFFGNRVVCLGHSVFSHIGGFPRLAARVLVNVSFEIIIGLSPSHAVTWQRIALIFSLAGKGGRVARLALGSRVVGSNPTPATNSLCDLPRRTRHGRRGFLTPCLPRRPQLTLCPCADNASFPGVLLWK